MSPEQLRAVAVAARRQDGNVTSQQVRALAGVCRRTVTRWRAAGLLLPVFATVPSVLRLASFDPSARQRLRAAILAVGDGAVASFTSAAAAWDLGDLVLSSPFHVSSPLRCRIDFGGEVIVRQVSTWARLDTTTLGGLPVTSVARTIFDCASVVAADVLEDLLIEAVRRWPSSVSALEEVLARIPNGPGTGDLRRLLRRFDPDEAARLMSRLETRFLRAFKRAGLPPPAVNKLLYLPDGSIVAKVDFVWEEWGIVVEIDGLRFHSSRSQKEYDDRRQNALVLSGRTVLRYSAADLDRIDEVVAQIATALDAAAARRV